MVLSSENVRVAVTGAVSIAPTDAPAPTDASSALPTPWVDLGYVHEDGVVETRERETEQLRAWQNADVVRDSITEATLTFQMVLIETKREVLELFYGAAIRDDGSLPITPSATGGRRSVVIDVVDGTDYIRCYLPTAEVTEVGEQALANAEPVGYDITLTAYPGRWGYAARKWYSTLTPAATTATASSKKK